MNVGKKWNAIAALLVISWACGTLLYYAVFILREDDAKLCEDDAFSC